jgi:hypothetical protein
MPKAKQSGGDPKLAQLFEEYDGRLVSPSGAAALLGVTRQTVNTLLRRGELRAFRSDAASKNWPKWVYIPLDDVFAYGERVGRRTSGT